MTPPSPGPSSSRGGRLAVVALALLALALGGWWGTRQALGDRAREREPRVTHQMVLTQIRTVARLATAEATVRDVVTAEHTRWWATKRALLVVTGRVSAGMDLGRDSAEVTVDDSTRRITVTLPPAELLTVEVLDVRTYDEQAGLLNPWRPADRDRLQREVRAQLEQAGRHAGLLTQADRNAAAFLEALLAREGYTVTVRVRPRPATAPPAG